MQGRRKGARLFHGGNTSVASSRRAPWPGARRIYSFFVTKRFPANRLTNNRDLLEKGDRRERSDRLPCDLYRPNPLRAESR